MELIQKILAARDLGFDPGPFLASVYRSRMQDLALDRSHRKFIEEHNGVYAYSTSLHIYGCSEALAFHDLLRRNASDTWRTSYGQDADGLVFFAEEVFGNQYAYSEQGIVMFDLETGQRTVVAADFDGWMKFVVEDTNYATGQSLAQQWSALYGPIPYGSHLCPKKPFVVGGTFTVDNLFHMLWERSLSLRADIARQIRDLPEGTKVKLTTRG
jgi:hypothetical protein